MAKPVARVLVPGAALKAVRLRTPESVKKLGYPPPRTGESAQLRWFEQEAPWYRRTSIYWVTSAKKPETRARRLATLIACSAAGLRIPPLRRT